MTDLPPFKRQRGVARPQPADAVAVTTASSFRWTQGRPPPRDTAFLGIHARGLADLAATLATGGIGPATAVDTAKAHLDPYGTLAEKHARVHPLAAAEAVMLAGKRMSSLVGCLSTTTAARDKAKEAGINPPLWSLGGRHGFHGPADRLLEIASASSISFTRLGSTDAHTHVKISSLSTARLSPSTPLPPSP